MSKVVSRHGGHASFADQGFDTLVNKSRPAWSIELPASYTELASMRVLIITISPFYLQPWPVQHTRLLY